MLRASHYASGYASIVGVGQPICKPFPSFHDSMCGISPRIGATRDFGVPRDTGEGPPRPAAKTPGPWHLNDVKFFFFEQR